MPASARPTGFSDRAQRRGALCHGLPSLITDCAVDIGTARAGVEGECRTPSHLQPAQQTKAPTEPGGSTVPGAQHTGQGRSSGMWWGGRSVPPPARAPALFSPGPRAACPCPLLTLTDAPAPIQALCGAGVLGHRCLALVPSVSIHPFSCPRPSVPPPSGPTLLAKSICPSG